MVGLMPLMYWEARLELADADEGSVRAIGAAKATGPLMSANENTPSYLP